MVTRSVFDVLPDRAWQNLKGFLPIKELGRNRSISKLFHEKLTDNKIDRIKKLEQSNDSLSLKNRLLQATLDDLSKEMTLLLNQHINQIQLPTEPEKLHQNLIGTDLPFTKGTNVEPAQKPVTNNLKATLPSPKKLKAGLPKPANLYKFSDLEKNMLENIMSHLEPKEVARFETVCKEWQKLRNSLKLWRRFREHQVEVDAKNNPDYSIFKKTYEAYYGKNGHLTLHAQVYNKVTSISNIFKMTFSHPYPRMHIIGPEHWKYYFGDVGKVPPLPAGIHTIMNSPCPFGFALPDDVDKNYVPKVVDTHFVALIPKTVNGKPLSLKSFGEIIKRKPHIFDAGEQADVELSESRWVLITCSTLNDSLGKTKIEHEAMIQNYNMKCKGNYQIPKALDATVCVALSGMNLGNWDPTAPIRYTRCQENASANNPLLLGAVYASERYIICHGKDTFVHPALGVIAMQIL